LTFRRTGRRKSERSDLRPQSDATASFRCSKSKARSIYQLTQLPQFGSEKIFLKCSCSIIFGVVRVLSATVACSAKPTWL
jgi:hypothetical protein